MAHSISIRVVNDNLFNKKVEKVSHPGYETLETHFTDIQAKNICSKMGNQKIRYFSALFLGEVKEKDRKLLRYQIHYLANKALQIYGGKILTFIFNLSRWPNRFRNSDVYISSLSTINSSDTNFPKIEIKSFEKGVHYTIHFKRAYERPVENIPILTIRNHKSSKTLKVSRDGLLIEKFDDAMPEILLFQENIDGDYFLYSGYDDGFCDICGRPLTDYISIKYGRGPICRRDNGTL